MKYRNRKFHSRLLWLTALCIFFLQNNAAAQAGTGEIVGSVQSESGKFLDNVSVIVTTSSGTQAASGVTDAKGSFQLRGLVVGQTYTVTLSSVGFDPETLKDVTATIKPKSIAVKLKEAAAALNNVVVTALGIKREQKALGYAAQQVDGKELTDARTNNWSSALSGKVAGLSLISPGSGPLNSTRISLRGDGSLNAESNQALIVVDGVPIQSGGT